jgi:hypothetical protein
VFELVGARLFVALQAQNFTGQRGIGGGTGAVTRRPATLTAGAAVFIDQPARAAHVGMAVRKALALALAPGFLPSLEHENLWDCHIFIYNYGSKGRDNQ